MPVVITHQSLPAAGLQDVSLSLDSLVRHTEAPWHTLLLSLLHTPASACSCACRRSRKFLGSPNKGSCSSVQLPPSRSIAHPALFSVSPVLIHASSFGCQTQ